MECRQAEDLINLVDALIATHADFSQVRCGGFEARLVSLGDISICITGSNDIWIYQLNLSAVLSPVFAVADWVQDNSKPDRMK